MKVVSPKSELITVTPSRGLRTALLVAAVLLCLLVLIEITFRPMRQPYEPMVWHASYHAAPLAQVIEELERAKIIWAGTTWAGSAATGRWRSAS